MIQKKRLLRGEIGSVVIELKAFHQVAAPSHKQLAELLHDTRFDASPDGLLDLTQPSPANRQRRRGERDSPCDQPAREEQLDVLAARKRRNHDSPPAFGSKQEEPKNSSCKQLTTPSASPHNPNTPRIRPPKCVRNSKHPLRIINALR
ncbi:MAG: hypothetical protein R3C01_17335 [Planctomycetaceae bacterium]